MPFRIARCASPPLISLALFIVAWCSPTSAVEPKAGVTVEQAEEVLREAIKTRQLPGGLIVAIVRGDGVATIAAAGLRKQGAKAPLKVTDRMHLGSCTKAMTATMLATLIEDGHLRWESTIGETFDDLEVHESLRAVSLRQLLQHRSGLRANPGNHRQYMLRRFRTSEAEMRKEIVEEELQRAAVHPPGSKFLYSNLGYIVAGAMAERVAKKPWNELMRKRLFEPLGMKSVGFGPPDRGKVEQPWGHQRLPLFGWSASQVDNPAAYGPAGTVHCDVGDWAKFVMLHMKLGPAEIVSHATLDELHKPPEAGRQYASGWGVTTDRATKATVLRHAGSNGSWLCEVSIDTSTKVAILVAANFRDQAASSQVQSRLNKLLDAAKSKSNPR